MTALIFGAFGLIIGSFLNVAILRHGARPVSGRSACFSCGTMLRWYDMIPVFSWLILGGRCRSCHSSISVQYPLVEAMTGVLFAVVGNAFFPLVSDIWGYLALADALLITAYLVMIAVYDLRHTIIPDAWAYEFAAAALFLALYQGAGSWVALLVTGPVVALPLFSLWLISGGRWMGLGDAKLALGMGWLLGPWYGLVAVFFAFTIGAVVSLPLVALSSRGWKRFISRLTPTSAFRRWQLGFTMKSEVPFGPFLIASCFIIWLTLLYNIPLPL